jgi:UDPglucose 6-dehydrogenase
VAFITIVGAGVVGTATGKGFASHGHTVRFVDTDPARITDLRSQGYDAAPPDAIDWPAADFTMISVNTPTIGGRVDLTSVRTAFSTLARGLAGSGSPHVAVIRSTVPPGTTSTLMPVLTELSGRELDERFGLAMNPEFLRQRSAGHDFMAPWLTLYGTHGRPEARRLHALYEPFGAPIVETDTTTAETIKYAHNLYNATKISFFNEFHLVAERLGIDSQLIGSVVSRSAEGMWRAEYGTRGGRPYDGACLPKDTVGFLSFARGLGLEMPLLAATVEVNEEMERRAMIGEPDRAADGPAPMPVQIEPVLEGERLA